MEIPADLQDSPQEPSAIRGNDNFRGSIIPNRVHHGGASRLRAETLDRTNESVFTATELP